MRTTYSGPATTTESTPSALELNPWTMESKIRDLRPVSKSPVFVRLVPGSQVLVTRSQFSFSSSFPTFLCLYASVSGFRCSPYLFCLFRVSRESDGRNTSDRCHVFQAGRGRPVDLVLFSKGRIVVQEGSRKGGRVYNYSRDCSLQYLLTGHTSVSSRPDRKN